MLQEAQINAACHIRMRRVTYKRVMSHVDLRSMSRELLLEYGNFSCESDNDSSISSCRACVCVCVFVYVKTESRDTSGEYRRKGQGGENR